MRHYILGAACLGLSSIAFAQSSTTRLTVPIVPEVYSDGGTISYPALSADGTVAMFLSPSTKLVPGDTNRTGAIVGTDVFIRDIAARTTRRLMGVGAVQPNGDASYAAMTRDGRYVFFVSTATNLVANDPNGAVPSVFRHDLQTDTTVMLANVLTNYFHISGDGRFMTYRQGTTDYLHDLTTDVRTEFIINTTIGESALNQDGSIIAFEGILVPGFSFNGFMQVFVRDRTRGVYELISKRADGQGANSASSAPVISADGRYVAFQSAASNLVPDDTNGVPDVFLHDRTTGQTTRVSLSTTGTQRTTASTTPAISGDGAVIAFMSHTVDCNPGCPQRAEYFVYDRHLASVSVVSLGNYGTPANGVGGAFALDHTGRRVAFVSAAGNLVQPDTNAGNDLFLRDRGLSPGCAYDVSPATVDVSAAGGTAPVTVAAAAGCAWGAIGFDSWVTVPSSPATGPGTVTVTVGANTGIARFGYIAIEGRRVLIRQPGAQSTTPPSWEHVSLAPDGSLFTYFAVPGGISADGRFVAFYASNVRTPNGYSLTRIYLRDRASGITTEISSALGGPADITNQQHTLLGVGSHESAVVDGVGAVGGGGNQISTDSRFVYFTTMDAVSGEFSRACYVFDRDSGRSSQLPSGLNFFSLGCPLMNATGRFFAGVLGTVNNTVFNRVVFYDRVIQERTEFTFPGLAPGDVVQGVVPSVSGRYLIAQILTGCAFIAQCSSQYSVILDRTTGATARTVVSNRTENGDRAARRLRAQLLDQAWMEFGLPRFHTRHDEAFTGCEVVDRQTGQRTALPGLRAAQEFAFECGVAVNNGRQVLFSTVFEFSPGDIYGASPDLHVYTIATGNVTRLGTGPDGLSYVVSFPIVSQNARYVLGQARDPQVGNTFVRRAVVFDLGVGSDPVDSTTPTNLQASVTGTTVALAWAAPSQGAATSYVIEAGSSTGASNLAVVETGNPVTSLTTPAPPGTYFVRVYARINGSLGGPSNEVVLTVPGGCTNPAAPSGLTHSVTGASVTLTWQAASGATRYVLEAGASSGSSNLVNVDTGTASTTFSAIAPPGTYYVRVRGRNNCGTSAPSNETTVVVGGGCPLPLGPSNLTGSVSGQSVSLSWVAAAGGITGYVLEAGSAPGLANVGQFDIGPGTALSAVAPPGTYFVRVRARSGCGLGPASNELTLTIN
jgi:Tol biopolymer transport system component